MKENLETLKKISRLEKKELSPKVAISDELIDYKDKEITLSFKGYKHNKCQIGKIQTTEAKKLTKMLERISETKTKHLLSREESGIYCGSVKNSGKYTDIYKGIPNDVEVLEIHYDNGGRIFGFLVHNIFKIILILKKHKKID
jgi:hypothetical protein